MVYDPACDLLAVIQRRSMVFHTRNFVGDLMSRIVSDSWCINAMADNLLLKPAHVLFTLVSTAVVMTAMDLQMTMLSLTVAPFTAGSSFLIGRPVRAAAQVSREIAAQMQSHVQQTLSGMAVVQAFAQEERAQERFLTFASTRIRAEQRNILVRYLRARIRSDHHAGERGHSVDRSAPRARRSIEPRKAASIPFPPYVTAWADACVDRNLPDAAARWRWCCRRLSSFPCRLPTT